MTKVELLKEFAKGWFGNSQQHSIHAQLLKARGFGKLGDKIMAESDGRGSGRGQEGQRPADRAW